MAEKVKVWFDPEGDFLEVQFSNAPRFMSNCLRGRHGARGRARARLGFSVLGVSRFKKDHPLEAELMTGT